MQWKEQQGQGWGGAGLLPVGAPVERLKLTVVAGPVMLGARGGEGAGSRQRVGQGREGGLRRRVGQ